ncbi:hypothetical protein ACH4CE_11450 [Streptomyces gelaticus]|uniref:hypothetical protein n=1 Tax=Streptomyces gelaticus TaxID=285446 RepID=UPI0037885897
MASKPLFRFGTYNLLELEIPKTAEHKQRYDRLVAGITAASSPLHHPRGHGQDR